MISFLIRPPLDLGPTPPTQSELQAKTRIRPAKTCSPKVISAQDSKKWIRFFIPLPVELDSTLPTQSELEVKTYIGTAQACSPRIFLAVDSKK